MSNIREGPEEKSTDDDNSGNRGNTLYSTMRGKRAAPKKTPCHLETKRTSPPRKRDGPPVARKSRDYELEEKIL